MHASFIMGNVVVVVVVSLMLVSAVKCDFGLHLLDESLCFHFFPILTVLIINPNKKSLHLTLQNPQALAQTFFITI